MLLLIIQNTLHIRNIGSSTTVCDEKYVKNIKHKKSNHLSPISLKLRQTTFYDGFIS